MRGAESTIDRRGRLPRWLVRLGVLHPRVTLLVWMCVAVVATPGVMLIKIETSTDSVLDQHSEAWSYYRSSQRRFGGDEILTILIEGDAPFDRAALEDVRGLTRQLEQVEGVRRVDSLASVPLVWSEPGGELHLDPGLNSGLASDPQGWASFEARVRRDRIAPRSLISADEKAFAINVILEQGAEAEYARVFSEIDRVLGGRSAWVSGVPVFRTQADLRTRAELLTFIPLTLLCAAVVLFAMFRSIVAVVVPLVTSATACWVVLGTMGGAGVPITIATVLLPSIILALSCAYAMHMLSAGRGCRTRVELAGALDPIALPVALSGLTTSVGFVAISAVRIDAIEAVGTYGALGVLVITASTLTALPALLALAPIPHRGYRNKKRQPILSGQYRHQVCHHPDPALHHMTRHHKASCRN